MVYIRFLQGDNRKLLLRFIRSRDDLVLPVRPQLDYLCTYDVSLFLTKATHFIGMHSHSVFLFSFTKTPSRFKLIGVMKR